MILNLRVKPGSKKPGIVIVKENEWIVMVKEQPEDGKANDAVVEAVANKFGIAKTKINFLKGVKSKRKILEIPDEYLK